MEPSPTSLAFALLGAACACVRVRTGGSLPDALAPILIEAARKAQRGAPSDPAGAIQDLAYRAMRGRGRSDALLAELVQRLPSPPLLRELLVVAIALIEAGLDSPRGTTPSSTWPPLDSAPNTAPYSHFTIVDQAVDAAASVRQLSAAKGLVNAVLRRLLRDHGQFVDRALQTVEGRWNYPEWWVNRVRDAYPAQWHEVLAVGDLAPPLVLRVNVRKIGVDDYVDRLRAAGIGASRVGASAVRLDTAVPVARLPGFAAGLASVQDEAAQRAAPLLDARAGMRVLDACAAPGGKTAHLLEIADLDLTALDVSAKRLHKVRENLDRLGLDARLVAGDAREPGVWWDRKPFDRILADVPCTASGIVRRHPDIRWLRRETDIAALSRIQQQILDSLWRLLGPGGKLLLVTCSIFPEESALQKSAFAGRHADAQVLAAPGQLLPTRISGDPSKNGVVRAESSRAEVRNTEHDGLFFALFEKAA